MKGHLFWKGRNSLLAWLLLGGCIFFFYVSTLAPGVLGGDPGELQFVPTFLGLTHPSGYPLQVLLDKIWVSIIPWGSIAWRTNLLSAVVATLGSVLIYQYGVSVSHRLAIGVLGAMFLAFTQVYWSQAVLADKYALNGLLTAVLILSAYAFWRRPGMSTMVLLVFTMGLAIAHHRALAVFLPMSMLLILIRGRNLLTQWKVWPILVLAFVSPLSLYLFVYFSRKDLPPHFVVSFTPSLFLNYLLFWGSRGQVQIIPSFPSLSYYWHVFWRNFSAPLIIFAGIGLALQFYRDSRRRTWLIFLMTNFVMAAYFSANYENFDLKRRYVYFIPSYVTVGALFVEGLVGWQDVLEGKSAKFWISGGIYTVSCGLLLLPLPHRYAIQWREQHVAEPLGIWRQTLKTGQMGDRMADALSVIEDTDALVVADWEQATPLWYAQLIDGYCPDCVIVHYMDRLSAYKQAYPERPLYVARTLPEAYQWSYPNSVGPLVRLDPAPIYETRVGVLPLNITFDDRLILLGIHWTFGKPLFRPGTVLSFELIWQAPAKGKTKPLPYATSLRLIDPMGNRLWQNDQTAPVLSMFPFDHLHPGEVIRDYHEVPIPLDTGPGKYQVRLVLYQINEKHQFVNAEAFSKEGNSLGRSITLMTFFIDTKN